MRLKLAMKQEEFYTKLLEYTFSRRGAKNPLLCPTKDHMRGRIFGTSELANSIRSFFETSTSAYQNTTKSSSVQNILITLWKPIVLK